MFRIINDTIEYHYIPVATFLPSVGATVRALAADEIESILPDMISAKQHADELRKQEKEFEKDMLRVEEERDRAQEEAEKWLGELNSLDDADNAGNHIVTLVNENVALGESVKHWRRMFERSQETIRQMQFEAKHQKSSKKRPLDRRHALIAD